MVDEQSDEDRIIAANSKLVTSDDVPVVCHEHGVTKRWGDLSPIIQLAVLAGLDLCGDTCMLNS